MSTKQSLHQLPIALSPQVGPFALVHIVDRRQGKRDPVTGQMRLDGWNVGPQQVDPIGQVTLNLPG